MLLERAGGEMNVMKLVKLIYLVDRLSFEWRGIPVVGGGYLSMKNGPVTSEVLDLINSGSLAEVNDTTWCAHIEDRQGHNVSLISMPERLYVSDAEVEIIEEVWSQHGSKDQWQLRDWCHDNCPEWTARDSGRSSIMLGSIGSALGKSQEAIRRMRHEAQSLSFLDAVLG